MWESRNQERLSPVTCGPFLSKFLPTFNRHSDTTTSTGFRNLLLSQRVSASGGELCRVDVDLLISILTVMPIGNCLDSESSLPIIVSNESERACGTAGAAISIAHTPTYSLLPLDG